MTKKNKKNKKNPHSTAENGDIYNIDNDGDGRREPTYIGEYIKTDGTYVRGHYRARKT